MWPGRNGRGTKELTSVNNTGFAPCSGGRTGGNSPEARREEGVVRKGREGSGRPIRLREQSLTVAASPKEVLPWEGNGGEGKGGVDLAGKRETNDEGKGAIENMIPRPSTTREGLCLEGRERKRGGCDGGKGLPSELKKGAQQHDASKEGWTALEARNFA